MLETKQYKSYTVTQAGIRESVRRVNMVKAIGEMHANGELDDVTLTALSVYPHIAACVSPLISVDEFLQIPERELDALSQVAMELNPHWFDVAGIEKKTRKRQRTSTNE